MTVQEAHEDIQIMIQLIRRQVQEMLEELPPAEDEQAS